MSNLNSIFDTLRGWPDGSALEASFKPDPNVAALVEGVITKTENRQLAAAAVLKIVDDSLITAPTLVAGDAGKAYEIATNGGVWGVFADGDIVEWSGTAWNLVVAQSGGDPPDGTRAVVVSASAAGSFSGEEETVQACTTGTWAVVDTPVNGNRILISGTNGIYDGRYFDYTGTHPAGAWSSAVKQKDAPAVVSKLSSGALASTPKDDAWVVIQGNDQWDAQMAGVVTCLKLNSGCAFKLQHDAADSLVAGTLVEVVAGVLQARTDKWPVGLVIYTNGIAGTDGYIVVASF